MWFVVGHKIGLQKAQYGYDTASMLLLQAGVARSKLCCVAKVVNNAECCLQLFLFYQPAFLTFALPLTNKVSWDPHTRV